MMADELLRVEDRKLLTGRGRFVDDVHLDRMLQGVFIRSPHAHAEIVGIDASAALAAGAHLVLTAKDLPFLDRDFVVRYWHKAIRGGLPKFLATDRVRFVGDPVAFLVADDRYQAEDLAALVDVHYRPLPPIPDIEAARKPGAPTLHDAWVGNIASKFSHNQADMPHAMANAPRRMTRRFWFGRQTPMTLETRGCLADFDADAMTLTAWVSTQAHYNVRQNLSTILDLPEYNVRVIAEDVGGGFGGKSRTFAEEIVVSHASRVLRRPVKWIEDRFEHLQATTHSRAIETEMEIGYDDDGVIQAIHAKITLDIGGYVFTSGTITPEIAGANIIQGYKCRNIAYDVECVGTNKTPIATYRGAGQPEATFPIECMLDLIAKDVGLSAVEVRCRNLITPADLPWVVGTPKGWAVMTFYNGDFPAAFAQGIRNSGFSEEVEVLPGGEIAAWGFSCGTESSGFVNFESAQVLVDVTGKVVLRSGMSSQGQGHITVFGELCAETLGVDVADVRVRLGDTDLIDFGRGAFATRGVVVGANAVAGAARLMREKVLKHAATLLQAEPDALTIEKGRIRYADGRETALSLKDIALAVVPGGPLYTGETALEAEYIYDIGGKLHAAFCIQVVRVAVDPRTGVYRVLDVYVMHDAGRILHHEIVEGQTIGGAVDGLGGATLAELLYDEHGQLLTGSLAEYLVITAPEVPRIRTDHFTTIPETNPLGVRGVGEGGVIPTGPAIVNALARIVNRGRLGGEEPLFRLPVRPEAVLAALDNRNL